MKFSLRRTLYLGVSFLCLIACKQQNTPPHYTITGTVEGLNSGWVKLISKKSGNKLLDSVPLTDGQFKMEGSIDHVDMFNLSLNDKYYLDQGFFLENSNIHIEFEDIANVDEYDELQASITGSKHHNAFLKQKAEEEKLKQQDKYLPIGVLTKALEKAFATEDKRKVDSLRQEQKKIMHIYDEQRDEILNSKINYIRMNPTSPVSAYVIGYEFNELNLDKDKMEATFNMFEEDVKLTAMYQYIKSTYKTIFETLAEGAPAPDFTLKTLQGENFKLSEVKGKYIFLDFWASWCGPCRSSFPHLKELYTKYHKDGFEVIGIGTLDTEDKWRAAISEDKTPWKHVFDDRDKIQNNNIPVSALYSVSFLPTTYLLDTNGNIVSRQLRGEDLEKKLEEVFGH